MAPVVSSAITLLALAASITDAKPLLAPGRHAPPGVANHLSIARRSLHNLLARYYGTSHGLSKPPSLPEKRDTSLPSGWSYFGCVAESNSQRLLQGFAFSSSTLTPLLCVNECTKLGYSMAGTEYGDECYCGNEFVGSGGGMNDDSACNMACEGDESAQCGNAWFLNLYTYNSSALASCSGVVPTLSTSATLSAATVVNGTTSVGAITGVPTGALAVNATGTAAVNVTATASTSAPTSTFPVHEVTDDSSEWYALGCAIDHSTRVLNGYVALNQYSLTVDSCLTVCEDKGFAYAGVEFGKECYCGAALPTDVKYSQTACNMKCAGDASETCGGSYAIELFELIGANCTDDASPSSTLSNGQLIVTTGGVTTTKTPAVTKTATTAANTTKAAATTATTTAAAGTTAAPASTTVLQSGDDHEVWAHHMVGNTYPYGTSEWANDISAASAAGIDGFALNFGSDWWQTSRIADAYSVAAASGFKMFLSLDMTVLACNSGADAANLVNVVKQFSGKPAQAMHEGKVLVSTFAGSDCQINWKNDFVNALARDGVNIFFVPSVFSDPSTFASATWMDGELNWNSGWPMGSSDLDTSSDTKYMNALGSKEYMPAISPFFYTHFGQNSWNKNWLYRSDDWLYCTRWEQVIAMRNEVKMTEILTWNDFGESSYIGPIAGALPSGSEAWVDGFTHTALSSLTKYYATAFKTGAYPSITKDEIVMWARPHPHDAQASSDSVGKPTGWSFTEDNLYAVVLASQPSTVTLTSGSNTQTFSVSAGLTKLKIPMSAGSIGGAINRSGSNVASYNSGSAFSYTTSPAHYNYNYFVGSSSN
ncbi:hypothetical protein CI109_102393 [Kwoniella shandongensis]|uniref:Uncharacterized protein n=1 Tax=Kwoniella shandongensis TaxID=1734106 RepID=A0A5M6BZS7_9TREE|nr:uncharacterized protein CI109_003287 [Kwoniella shandongensis]KAA5528387.1 hypothetical protein CI109_003287 [Kwoniella shandongensis]